MPSGPRSGHSKRRKSPPSPASERDAPTESAETDGTTPDHPQKHLCDYIVFAAKADLEKLVRSDPELWTSEKGVEALNCFTQIVGDVIWVLSYFQIGYGEEFYTPTGEFVDVLRSEETR
jgi:hypothetical protein